MKLSGAELIVLLLLLGRGRARGPVRMGNWVPPAGVDPLPVIPLPPNPLAPKR